MFLLGDNVKPVLSIFLVKFSKYNINWLEICNIAKKLFKWHK